MAKRYLGEMSQDLYGSPKISARCDVIFGADGFDQFGVEATSVLMIIFGVEEFVIMGVGSAGPAVAAEVVPQVFDTIELW